MGDSAANLSTNHIYLMRECILSYLQLNDLLRLRRTSKQFKLLSDDFIRNHFTNQEREINETNYPFSLFIETNLPTSHIFINNTQGLQIFEDHHVPKFLALNASKITHLRLNYFSACRSPKEKTFFSSLPNLQHLEVSQIDARERSVDNYRRKQQTGVKQYFPENFRNLKTLKINEANDSLIYIWDLIEFCQSLEHLRYPMHLGIRESRLLATFSGFICIQDWILRKVRRGSIISLHYVDLQHFGEKASKFSGLGEFMRLCSEQCVKFLNVDSLSYEVINRAVPSNVDRCVPFSIMSMKNVQSAMFLRELPNLEKVSITSTERSSYEYDALRRAKWPNLTVLDINIDSDEMRGCDRLSSSNPKHVTEFYDFLFNFAERNNLEDLSIRFDTDAFRGGIDMMVALPCPKVGHIIRTCKNVKKLLLSNWQGTNGEISKFWKGLPCLESVVLEDCRNLDISAFIGENGEDPVLLKLTKLRKFTLMGLEKMPRVTDEIFEIIFRRLKVKEFYLKSRAPIKSLSIQGIRSLLTGSFNSYVEKFPFTGWSLENVSEQEMVSLFCQFRSSRMI